MILHFSRLLRRILQFQPAETKAGQWCSCLGVSLSAYVCVVVRSCRFYRLCAQHHVWVSMRNQHLFSDTETWERKNMLELLVGVRGATFFNASQLDDADRGLTFVGESLTISYWSLETQPRCNSKSKSKMDTASPLRSEPFHSDAHQH
jgi:hypothetical protein